jgi:NADH:ubiquinone oxidoreductase subunit 5 (subunit L)/multisubunit Na+/H+ antiporter MnhA subunit
MIVMGFVVGAPLLATVLTSCCGGHISRSRVRWPACIGAALSLAGSVVAAGLLCRFDRLPQQPLVLYRWVTLPGESCALSVALQFDPLSALFLIVLGIATLVVLLHHATRTTTDDSAHRVRFFAGASFLQFSTAMLVLATDWLTVFCFWQLTAVAAWLIARNESGIATNTAPSTRRYITLRTADFVMLLGCFLFWNEYATFDFAAMLPTADKLVNAGDFAGTSTGGIGLCLFLAAATRCSLFPLITGRQSTHIDCRSTNALIESALLMPVGVYLVARAFPLITSSPTVVAVVICMGAASTIAGAISAAVQTEPRRRLSATATSLFGMAVLGLGTGTTAGGTAALVLVTVHILTVTGLWLSTAAAPSKLHVVQPAASSRARWAFAVNALVLCSGIWGQHAILISVVQMSHDSADPRLGQLCLVAYWCALASLPCLSFAMTRGFSTLPSQAETTGGHSSPAAWSWLLWGLPSAAAVIPPLLIGFPDLFDVTTAFRNSAVKEVRLESLLTVDVGLPLVLLGAVVAWLKRSSAETPPQQTRRGLTSLASWSLNDFGLPQVWSALVMRPVRVLSQLCRLVDTGLFDVVLKALPGRLVALPSRLASPLQAGQIQFCVLSVLLATALLLLVLSGLRG